MPAASPKSSRLESIDYLRGLVMVIMALDHVRDFFSSSPIDPLDPGASTPLYLTRLITNICAPTFLLLAGVSAGLMAERKTNSELSRFLLTRGLWLIVLEAAIITFSWKFEFSGYRGHIWLLVIWAIGVAMIVLAGLIHLPRTAVWVVGLAIVFGHNLLDGLLPQSGYPNESAPLWLNLHRSIYWEVGGLKVRMLYPILAWSGVMACGFGLARVFTWDRKQRIQFLFKLGGGLLVLFLVLRSFNLYGDANTWQAGEGFVLTARDFLNVTKYPPSLHFLCFNLGFAVLILAAVEQWKPLLNDTMVTIGRVPLFYYVVHLYMAHGLGVLAGLMQGFSFSEMAVHHSLMPEGYGFGLFGVYVAWLVVLLIMYFPCRWFAQFKATRRDWWLSYL